MALTGGIAFAIVGFSIPYSSTNPVESITTRRFDFTIALWPRRWAKEIEEDK
jgi:hypothetical protein